MALIKYGGGIVQMSGSIAGTTHARNRYGNYVRARTKPINPNTALQVAVRTALSELTARWSQTLTAAQRTAWNLYASSVAMKNKLGETVYLSGFNHYIRSNSFRNVGGYATVDNGPVIFELPAADPTYAVAFSEATQQVTITYDNTRAWALEDGAYFVHFQGSPQNAQRNFFDGPWRSTGNIAGDPLGPPATPVAGAVAFAVAELQRVWCYARIARADGRLSEKFRADTFCAA